MNRTLHHHTPMLTATDGRGLAIRHVEYHRATLDDPPQARISRAAFDAAGRQMATWDARLNATLAAPNQTATFSLNGATLLSHSADAGKRINRYSDSGLARESWDSRGTHSHTVHDTLLRPLSVTEQFEDDAPRVILRFTYGGNSPETALHNQCAQLIREDDTAGTLLYPDYGLLGQALAETRHFLTSEEQPDWPDALAERDELLEPGPAASTHWQFAATGESLVMTDATGTRHCSTYDVSGALAALTLVNEDGQRSPVTRGITYNAQGQIDHQVAGNGVISAAEYDEADGRLTGLKTVRPDARCLQSLTYQYDPVGNVVRIEDHAAGTQHYANQRVNPVNHYTYDSLSQLIKATGREALGASLGPRLPELDLTPGDTSRLLNFTQHYQYDSGGNLTRLQHVGHTNYTRTKHISATSNRSLLADTLRYGTDPDAAFDAGGNLLRLESGQRLDWNGFNQLSRTVSLMREDGAHDDERYLYDADGLRVRKITRAKARNTTHRAEVRYLPGLELHHEGSQRLRVVTVQGGLCSLRLLHWDAGKPSGIDNDQQRYSFDDPLGSCSLELDQSVALISHEGYYPFGGSAWWAARSAVQARYKTVRYSGKERDASGLYYFGQRYYAPWLQQWISPDPGGAIDGLNLYRMVGNNPVSYSDPNGMTRTLKAFVQEAMADEKRSRLKHRENAREQRARYAAKQQRQQDVQPLEDAVAVHREVLSISRQRADAAHQQLLNHTSSAQHLASAGKRVGALAVTSAIGTVASTAGAMLGTAMCPGAGTVMGLTTGFVVGKAVGMVADYGAEKTGMSASVKLKTSALSADKIFEEGEYKTASLAGYAVAKVKKMLPTSEKGAYKLGKEVTKTVLGKAPLGPVLKVLPDMPELIHENVGAAGGLSPDKSEKLDSQITQLINRIDGHMADITEMFDSLDVESVHTPDVGNVFKRSTPESLSAETTETLAHLKNTQALGRRLAQRQ